MRDFITFVVYILICYAHALLAIECLTASNGYQTSESGVQCVQCELRGYLDAQGVCVYEESEDSQRLELGLLPNITTDCPLVNNRLQCRVNGVCTESKEGQLCTECSRRGYITYTDDLDRVVCTCYSSMLDPKTGCQPTALTGALYTEVNVSITSTKVVCESFRDLTLGCFAPVDSSKHQYGTPLPPVPTKCCSENYGPPPQQLVESLNVQGVVRTFEECTQPGGINPSSIGLNFTFFEVCNGNGIYNSTSGLCQCNRGWVLDLIGEAIDGSDLNSCIRCDTGFGPLSDDSTAQPPYCRTIWTPDPITGELKECSGRGTYLSGTCQCYYDSVRGYWNTSTLILGPGGASVQTCLRCSRGDYPLCLP
jgi:hypothetical protein